MISNLRNHSTIIILFILLSVILGCFVTQIGLYVDDNVLIFPAVVKSFVSHFFQFNYDNGLFRPLSLIYYYLLFTIYIYSPDIAHLIPLIFHLFSGILLIIVLKKYKVNSLLASSLGLIYVLNPFATEQYMYLSATNEIFVNLIFFSQLLIINKFQTVKKLVIITTILSFMSVLIFESTFFFFIPLSYLLIKKFIDLKQGKRRYLSYFAFGWILIIPNILYLLTKIIFPAHVLTPRIIISSTEGLIMNLNSMLMNIYNLFFNGNVIKNFWLLNIQNGIKIASQESFISILIVLFVVFLIRLVCQNISFIDKKNDDPPLIFWFFTLLSSLLPLLALKQFNFPFRALSLPLGISFILIPLIINKLINKKWAFKVLSAFILTISSLFMFIDISIASKYNQQIQYDTHITKKIKSLLSENYFSDSKPTYLLIKDIPHSMVYENFIHGDHILTCYHYWWCGQASLNMITGMVKDIGIQFDDGSYSSKTELPLDIFLKQRPLVIMRYSVNNLEVSQIYSY